MQRPADTAVESLDAGRLDDICVALVNQGYCILDDALPVDLILALQREAQSSAREHFHVAGTGRENQHQLDTQVRSDRILWMQRGSTASDRYLDFAEVLREGINSRLFLGLLDYEVHYARYEPGAFYGKHRDAFAGRRNRLISTVLYLNTDWQEGEGGELLLYDDQCAGPDGTQDHAPLQRLQPVLNRLVLFLSERFPHEVLPATRDRYSLAGWFRVRER
jgi:SM-20-related protein